ncbi:MAG: glycoside hydrolase family 9 protein, partial [Bacteroidota bacterium]
FEGAPVPWYQGRRQSDSGDRGWWFDFSNVSEPGSYYLYDVENDVGTGRFEVDDRVYAEALRAAVRSFFYQRVNFAKEPPFADPRWADPAAFEGPEQDRFARAVNNRDNAATARDLHGGWFDAGDFNKYVTFAQPAVNSLLSAYLRSPELWDGFTLNIPESRNGLPDLLDEVKWELDWVMRMQDDDGGLFIKMGNVDHGEVSPPSSDPRPRYYEKKCSSSALAGAIMFAQAAPIYARFPEWAGYAEDLLSRAERAMAWYRANPRSDSCDPQVIKAGDADRDYGHQDQMEVVASIYLLAATGNEAYHDAVKRMYARTRPWQTDRWGLYFTYQGDALLAYTKLPNADPAIVSQILSRFRRMRDNSDVTRRREADDLYRAFLPVYTWGSNSIRSALGSINMDVVLYGEAAGNEAQYRERALGVAHYIHGVNPFGMTYLSNMYDHGAERSVNEFYHRWFQPGTQWQNALTSAAGPVPGFLPGGPNHQYTGEHRINGYRVESQPLQKTFVESSSGNQIWVLSENAIYYSAQYIKMLTPFVAPQAEVRLQALTIPALDAKLNQTAQPSPIFEPAAATTTRLFWSTDNPEIIQVNATTGEVTPLALGTATLTAESIATGVTASTTVTVLPP